MVLTPLPPQSLELLLGPAPRCRLPFSHVWLCKGERAARVGRCVEITNLSPLLLPCRNATNRLDKLVQELDKEVRIWPGGPSGSSFWRSSPHAFCVGFF